MIVNYTFFTQLISVNWILFCCVRLVDRGDDEHRELGGVA